MIKVIFDTNILLDYFGVCRAEKDRAAAVDLVTELAKRATPFLVTPHTMNDFHYLLQMMLKRAIREEYGEVTEKDAVAVRTLAEAALEQILDVGTIASEDLATCEMARVLYKQHADYEDNLIAAVALRIDATCIVTRDARFASHCPVMCCTPAEALSYIQTGVWA